MCHVLNADLEVETLRPGKNHWPEGTGKWKVYPLDMKRVDYEAFPEGSCQNFSPQLVAILR